MAVFCVFSKVHTFPVEIPPEQFHVLPAPDRKTVSFQENIIEIPIKTNNHAYLSFLSSGND